MKFYKTKHAEIGEGVEATVLFHKDNGDELILVRSGWDAFAEQNPKAKECTIEDADKLLQKKKIKLTIPKRKEIRKDQKLSDDDLLKEIENPETLTVSVNKTESEEGQVLTYIEEVEIVSVEDFLKAQNTQASEPEAEIIDKEPQETII